MAKARKVTPKTSPRKGIVTKSKVKAAVKKVFEREYLTPKQFMKLPLSKAILQVVEDVKMIRDGGIKIDMNSWWSSGPDNTTPCSVCLGGAALCSFSLKKVDGLDLPAFATKVLGIESTEGWQIAQTFDALRVGNLEGAFWRWYNVIYLPLSLRVTKRWAATYKFFGSMNNRKIGELIRYLEKLSLKLQKAGY